MSPIEIQSKREQQCGAIRLRLRELGMPYFNCTEAGDLQAAASPSSDWLHDLFAMSPLFARALTEAASVWSQQTEPEVCEKMPGLHLAPIPTLNRRRRSGYGVAVILTEDFLQSEQLLAMCQSALADHRLTLQLLQSLPPASSNDVPRITALVRHAACDLDRLAGDKEAMESVGQQLAESYEEINLLYTIIQSMNVIERPERFISIVCEELRATLPYAWIGVRMADDPEQLRKLSSRLFITGETGMAQERLRWLTGRLLTLAAPDAPLIVEPGRIATQSEFADLGNTILVHPLTREDKVIGILIASDRRGSDPTVSSVDMKLVGATAAHMGIFLENASLYEDLNAMFLGTLEGLTASIDAKDRYTCGHSQRVALLSSQLARELGMSDSVVNRVHIAGLVHDVGKIGVPERVLCKPGRLTDEEFDWIRKHPTIGHKILRDIPQLKDVLPGVLHHHERWDGRGYPEGLAGEAIPMFARLIALADSFDAMSSNRTYRSALSRGEVLSEIRRCAGTQFDPRLTPAFVRLDFSEYDRLVYEHQAIDVDLRRDRGQAA